MFFVKYHPQINSKKTDIDSIINIGSKLDKNFKKDFDTAKTNFLVKYASKSNRKEMAEMFDKQYLSNVMYELSMNDLKINTSNIRAILGAGFINKSSAFNKRSQIWFSNGWAGDKKFIQQQKALNLTKDGDYNYIIARDLSKKDEKLNHNFINLLKQLFLTIKYSINQDFLYFLFNFKLIC